MAFMAALLQDVGLTRPAHTAHQAYAACALPFLVNSTLWGMKKESYHRIRRVTICFKPADLSHGMQRVCCDGRAAPAASLRLEASHYCCAASADAITLYTTVSSPPLLLLHACSPLRLQRSLGAHAEQEFGPGLRLPGSITARKRRLSSYTRLH